MKPNTCLVCNQDLPSEEWKSKYCGSACAEKAKIRTPKKCLRCGEFTESRDQTVCMNCRRKKCRKCNSDFTPKAPQIVFCSPECRLSERSIGKKLNQETREVNIRVSGIDMRWCKGHEQYHLAEDFPKDKFYCKQWRSFEGKEKYAVESKSENFMQSRRDKRLLLAHGLRPADILNILESQNFSCLVCGIGDSGRRPWHIDHDHNCCPSGRSCEKCRRGILCFKCNTGLGCLKDSIHLLEKAVEVITKFRFEILPTRQLSNRKRGKHALLSKENFAPSHHLKYAYSVDLQGLIELIGEPIECSICQSSKPGVMSWNVDHDHECCSGSKSCGKCIRGILCHLCNKGIGLLGDDPVLLTSAISYLESYQKKKVKNEA